MLLYAAKLAKDTRNGRLCQILECVQYNHISLINFGICGFTFDIVCHCQFYMTLRTGRVSLLRELLPAVRAPAYPLQFGQGDMWRHKGPLVALTRPFWLHQCVAEDSSGFVSVHIHQLMFWLASPAPFFRKCLFSMFFNECFFLVPLSIFRYSRITDGHVSFVSPSPLLFHVSPPPIPSPTLLSQLASLLAALSSAPSYPHTLSLLLQPPATFFRFLNHGTWLGSWPSALSAGAKHELANLDNSLGTLREFAKAQLRQLLVQLTCIKFVSCLHAHCHREIQRKKHWFANN